MVNFKEYFVINRNSDEEDIKDYYYIDLILKNIYLYKKYNYVNPSYNYIFRLDLKNGTYIEFDKTFFHDLHKNYIIKNIYVGNENFDTDKFFDMYRSILSNGDLIFNNFRDEYVKNEISKFFNIEDNEEIDNIYYKINGVLSSLNFFDYFESKEYYKFNMIEKNVENEEYYDFVEYFFINKISVPFFIPYKIFDYTIDILKHNLVDNEFRREVLNIKSYFETSGSKCFNLINVNIKKIIDIINHNDGIA